MTWFDYTTICYKTSKNYPSLMKTFFTTNEIFLMFPHEKINISMGTKLLLSLALLNIDNKIMIDSAKTIIKENIDVSSGKDLENILIRTVNRGKL